MDKLSQGCLQGPHHALQEEWGKSLPADSLETMRVRKIGLARVEVALSGEGGGYADHMQ